METAKQARVVPERADSCEGALRGLLARSLAHSAIVLVRAFAIVLLAAPAVVLLALIFGWLA